LVDTARFLGGEIIRVNAKLVQKYGSYCWFVTTDFADGSVGHLDLTLVVRMGWHEGFQIYGSGAYDLRMGWKSVYTVKGGRWIGCG
jgi:hypothetical protein